jgi:hypothetical protein
MGGIKKKTSPEYFETLEKAAVLETELRGKNAPAVQEIKHI